MKEYARTWITAGALGFLPLAFYGLILLTAPNEPVNIPPGRNATMHETLKQYPLEDEKARELKKNRSVDEDQRWLRDNVIDFGGPVYPPLKD